MNKECSFVTNRTGFTDPFLTNGLAAVKKDRQRLLHWNTGILNDEVKSYKRSVRSMTKGAQITDQAPLQLIQ